MTIGERIKARRKELGLTAEELAEALHVSRSSIFRYEKGEIEKMPIDFLQPLSKLLRVTPAYLMGWEDNPDQKEKASAEAEAVVNGDPELTEYLDELKNRDEMLKLFSLIKSATKEDIMRAIAIIEALRREEEGK